jgi:hypothetical protein
MRLRLLGAGAALLAAAALLLLWSPWRNLPPGPLGDDSGAPNRIAFGVEVGRPFSYGLVVLRNPAAVPLEIVGVELVGATGAIELVASSLRHLSDAPGHGLVANDRTYPPAALAGHLRPALGARIGPSRDPSDADELVLGLRVAATGSHGFSAVAVGYRLGGDRYRVVFPYALVVCAPPSAAGCGEPG